MALRVERHRAAEASFWAVEGATPTEAWVRLPGAGVRVRTQTVGSGPDVLFVHGGSTSGTSWAPLAARLPGLRCILLDRPGCGLSEPLPRPIRSMEVFEPFADRLVPDVLDALGIERAHLIATSFGSYFALRAAAASPERVGRMVLVGFPVGAEATDTPLAMRMTAVPGLGPLLTRLPVAERVARTMLRQLGLGAALDAGRLPDEGLSWFRSLLNDTGTMRNELAAMPPVMDPRHGLSPDLVLGADLLGSIAVPTLLLWGSIDPLGGERVARTFAPRIPGADLEVLPGVGHVPWLDDPDRVAAAVEAFLVARPGGAGKGVPPPWTP